MFSLRKKYVKGYNTRRRPNRSFSIPEKSAAKKVKKGASTKIETGYLKRISEWSSCSSIEETCVTNEVDKEEISRSSDSSLSMVENTRDAAEESPFSLFMEHSELQIHSVIKANPLFDVQCFEGEFKPIAESTPKLFLENEHQLSDFNEETGVFDVQCFEGEFRPIAESTPKIVLENEHQLSYFNEETGAFGDNLLRDKLPTITDELQPIILPEQFQIPNLIDNTFIKIEDEIEICQDTEDQILQLNEQFSTPKTLKNKERRITKFSQDPRKKMQTRQNFKILKSSQIGNVKRRQSNFTANNIRMEDKDRQNISPISSKTTDFKIALKHLLKAPQGSPDFPVNKPKRKYIKKKITKSTQNSRSETYSAQNTETNRKNMNQKDVKKKGKIANPASSCKTKKQSAQNKCKKIEKSQYYCSTSSKLVEPGSRRTFKTLGYCKHKDPNLPICTITTLKDPC